MAIQVSYTPHPHTNTVSRSHSLAHSFLPCADITILFRFSLAHQIMCHELGCLPVSKLCGLPEPAGLLRPEGTPVDPDHRMLKQLPELLDQLEWMAVAMKSQR